MTFLSSFINILSGSVSWIQSVLYTVCLWFDGIIYSLVSYAFELFMIMCQLFIIIDIMTIKIDEIDKKVGMNIRLERVKRSISQEGLADMAGLARSTMGIVERGEQSPSIQTLTKIANALNIDLYKLFIFED